MVKSNMKIDNNPLGIASMPPKTQAMPQDTGMAFAGVRVYVFSVNPKDAEVCGLWLKEQAGPIRDIGKNRIVRTKMTLAITSLQYGMGRPIALETKDGMVIERFMNWMAGIIGPPKSRSSDNVIFRPN